MILLYILAGIAVNYLIGCCVLAAVDNKDQRLFQWACECPMPGGYALVVLLWPLTAYFWLTRESRKW